MGKIIVDDTFDTSGLDSNQKIDIPELFKVIDATYLMNRDGQYTSDQRAEFLTKGDRLLEQATQIVKVYFEKGVEEIKTANKEIKKTKNSINQSLLDIEKTADTIEQLGTLINSLSAVINLLP
ncbi:MAG TPA: hypothetical protein VGC62_20330 [Pseudomonas sp.]|uniref:hypothetical protein n=1 Tax=Pseudomonas sp. TaxID=306 RepID=UPI002ED8EAD6